MSFTQRTLYSTLTLDGVLKKGRALDLGCGNGRDALFLIKNDFVVDAVDYDIVRTRELEQMAPPSLKVITSKIEDFIITPNTYNLISAQFVLHFLQKESVIDVLQKMAHGITKTGVISFNLLGHRDDWKEKWTVWTKEEVEEVISRLPLKVYKTLIEEGSGTTRGGISKYWHIINFVLVSA